MLRPPSGRDWVELGMSPLPVDDALSWATTPASGGVVSFAGVVRDHSEGRAGVVGLTYEAYAEVAQARMAEIVALARDRWPALVRLALLHRVGDLDVSDVSVLVVASSAHRDEAFAAARFCIDTLKETVPIWKREHWGDASGWSEAARPIRSVDPEVAPRESTGGAVPEIEESA